LLEHVVLTDVEGGGGGAAARNAAERVEAAAGAGRLRLRQAKL
jgi:hypothetical protein